MNYMMPDEDVVAIVILHFFFTSLSLEIMSFSFL